MGHEREKLEIGGENIMPNTESAPAQNRWNFHLPKSPLLRKVLGILVIAVVIVVALSLVRSSLFTDQKSTKLGFEDIGELATQSAYCTQVNVTEADREFFGISIPFTQSKYIYSYDVVIKAGYDFDGITWGFKDDNTIVVHLPEPKIISSDILPDSFEVYLEDESIFRQITLTETNTALQELEENAEKDAIANGLFENARANAETILTGFFANVYNPEEYNIEFEGGEYGGEQWKRIY